MGKIIEPTKYSIGITKDGRVIQVDAKHWNCRSMHLARTAPRDRYRLAYFLRRERIKSKVGAPPLPTLREWLRSNK